MTSSETEDNGGVRSELRRDAVTNRWVIISSGRAKRPSDFASKSSATSDRPCPFCSGNEHLCAPEIFRFPPNSSDWTLRVVENLFPALRRGVPTDHSPPEKIEGVGFHDVIVESPIHSVNLSDLAPERIADVFLAYRKRIEQISAYESFEYVQVFKNHGASAGASLSHSHSQMLALPIVPQAVTTRVESMKEYYDRTWKCCLCEIRGDDHLIDSSAHFIAVVPVAASFPFEIWIIPRDHSPHFHEIDHDKAVDLGGLLKLMLRKLAVQLNDPPFNFMIQTSPLKAKASEFPHSHWYLQIVPQLSGVGGFEIGSGCYINSVIPEEAAKTLREVFYFAPLPVWRGNEIMKEKIWNTLKRANYFYQLVLVFSTSRGLIDV